MTGFYSRHQLTIGIGLLALLLLTLVVFHPALSGPFVFDDFPNLENLRQLEGHPTVDAVRRYMAAYGGNPGRPLATISFLIEDSAWPTDPAPFKRNNLLLHLIVGLLVFALARALAARLHVEEMRGDWIAIACAGMWLLQPMQLSATMLVVQRMNILSTLFMLLGLLGYLRILAMQRMADITKVMLAGATLGLFGVLAFLCKENGILIFAYAVVLNITVLREPLARYASPARYLLHLGTALPMVALGIGALMNADSILAVYRIRDFSLGERLLTESRILIEYLRIISLPRVSGQGVFHDAYPISRGLLDPPSTLLATLAILALLISALKLRRRAPVYAFAVLWFFAGHLLESTVVALELYFEHRNYLPMVGPLFAMAYAAFSLPAPSWRSVAQVLLALWIAACASLTWMNAGIWGDRGRLAMVWLAENPNSMRAVQMVASYQYDNGDGAAAGRTLDDGIQRLPAAKELVFQRVLLDCLQAGISPGRWAELHLAARTAPRSGSIPEVVAALVSESLDGRCHGTLDRDQLRGLVAELMRNPIVAEDPTSKGFLHYELGKLALQERNLDLLMHHLDEAYRYRQSPFVAREQAIYLLSAGLPEEALRYLDRSEHTPMPLIKKWLIDMPRLNAPLHTSARQMMEVQSKMRQLQ